MAQISEDADLRLPVPERSLSFSLWKTQKPKEVTDGEWEVLDQKAQWVIWLSLTSTVTFNVSREKTTQDMMETLSKMYEKPSTSNKVFLMKLFNLKMADSESVAEHLNEFNTLTSQLKSVRIKFDD